MNWLCTSFLLGFLAVSAVSRSAVAEGQPPTSTPSAQAAARVNTPAALKPRSEGVRSVAPMVESFVRQALERAPSLAALRARIASIREQVAPSGALPDPMVGAMYQSMGPPWNPMPPMSMAQLEISQTLPGFGKRAARRTAVEADAIMRESDLGVLRARLGSEVRSAYARIFALDREREALEAAGELAQVLATGVTARYVTGQADQEATIKAELEQSAIAERVSDLEAERAELSAELNRLTAQPEQSAIGWVESIPEVTLDIGSAERAASERAPELRVQERAMEAARRRVESAETEAHPNFLVSLAGGATTSGDPIITLRFGVELPLWRSSKQEPMIRAARKDAEAAHQDLADLRLRVGEQAAKLIARWRRDNEQVRRYREVIIPETSMALDAARAGYATGRTDFTTLIVDFRAWLDAQVGQRKREAARYMTWAELYALTGGDSETR